MDTVVRPTIPADFTQTEFVTREAFWNVFKPGCDEHLILNQLRKGKGYIPDLDVLATFKSKIIGHSITTKARVVGENNLVHPVLCMGPVSVLPGYQNRQVGTLLVEASIVAANKLGFAGIILFGKPEYYHRFGFKNAKRYDITTKEGQNFEPFMALELQKGSLAAVSGRFYPDEGFLVDPKKLEEFDKAFPFRERLETETQFQ